MTRAAMIATALLVVAACDDRQAFHRPDPSWERMLEQPRVDPYAEPMRRPPPGTVAFQTVARGDEVLTGAIDGAYVARIPVPLSEADLRHAETQFDTYCAACHGVLGDGDSAVAPHMSLRRPPSLHEDRIRGYPPGRIFGVITRGYGLMPSYAPRLSVDERWGVVAYVEALQLSQHVATADLADDDRAALARGGSP
jgi:mono/diheme cytochrome c family protein